MISFGDIQDAEDFGVPDVVGERAERGEGEGVQDGPEVQQTKIPARPVPAVRLWLQMQRTAPGSRLGHIYWFYYTQL